MTPSTMECASELLEVVPLVMRAMRSEVRRDRTPELSMPQFRALSFVGRNEGAALTEVAAFLGLTLPTASKMIDGLVESGFVIRKSSPSDRRKLRLRLSQEGLQKYEAIQLHARQYLTGRLEHLNYTQREQISTALHLLREAFERELPDNPGSGKDLQTAGAEVTA